MGYVFYNDRISVRQAATLQLEKSLETLFRMRANETISESLFLWRLNLKISGCIYEHKKYGWLFYYSQLTDLTELYHLDWFIKQLFIRFNIERPIDLKTFIRTYHEITKNLNKSTYLFNADKYTMEQKKDIIEKIYVSKAPTLTDIQNVNLVFRQLMFKEIQKLEHDIQNFS